ncbi:MAG: DNA-binding transcriptional regulator [Pirellulales bacterium]|nr:DNA-binding transcriptional regulator [Pirellulales bacterium]
MAKRTFKNTTSRERQVGRPNIDGPARVAVIIETSHSFGRELFRGIARFIQENERWSVFFVERSLSEGVPKWLRKWSGHGIITRVGTPDIVDFLADKDIAIVDLNQRLYDLGVPGISNDHAAIGQMGAEHLLQRGFSQFGFVGHNGLFWSDARRDAFMQQVEEAGGHCDVYSYGSNAPRRFHDRTWELEMDRIVRWVTQLPKPVGIMACDDFRGLQLIEACAIARIDIPQQVAVLGVGNDSIACDLAGPPLSSILLNAFQMGYDAASLLNRLMRGEKVDCAERLLPPLDVVTRQSTDVMAVGDPLVSKAMQFIQKHACDGIGVPDVLRHVLVSRTVLQERFRSSLERTIHDMILEVKMKRVKELLVQTELPLLDICGRTAFKHPEYLCTVFKKHIGLTPTDFRKQHGQKPQRWFQIN